MINAMLILVLIPTVWSVAVQLIRFLSTRNQAVLHDTAEKGVLMLMLLPVIAGGVFLSLAPFAKPLIPALISNLPVFNTPVFDDFAQAAMPVATRSASSGPDFLSLGAEALLILCVSGAVIALARVWLAHDALRRIVKTARPVGDVLVTDKKIAAFAWGHRSIVLPATLHDALSATQLKLIVAHERAHQARHDPLYFLMLSIIEGLFWFNPAFTAQARACRLAAELACDAAVIDGTQHSPKTYAQTLLVALKHAVADAPSCVPTVASGATTYKLRLAQIMKRSAHPKAALWIAATLALATPVLGLQMAFAHGRDLPEIVAAPAKAEAPAAPAAGGKLDGVTFVVPIDAATTSAFGMRDDPWTHKMRFHAGIDFAAPIGTPVKASADGTVAFVGEREGYGHVIEIGHAGGLKTHYAHLSTYAVKRGDKVLAGQTIGAVGDSGKSKDPHLHFEIWQGGESWQGGKVVNPAKVLGLAAAN